MISQNAKIFLIQGSQLQENFSRMITINKYLNESKIDLSQLNNRLLRYDQLFDRMLMNPPKNQDWNFIVKQLKDNKGELDIYLSWIKDVDKSGIQITQKELECMIHYKQTLDSQIRQLSTLTEQ